MPPQGPVPPSAGPPQRSQPQAPPPPTQQLHPEIRSVVQLNHAHAHKVYFSGPLMRKIEYTSGGQKPIKDEWTEIWAQLGGTTLSIWDMKEIEAASKQGREVPPSYINVTDAYIQILGAITAPATETAPAKRYLNVLTVNTAGSNLYLFSCPSVAALTSWTTALRLASWEKSRLDEIYTAHLIRITLTARDVPTTLVKGKMEGWARVRIAGQSEWKKVWMVVQEGSGDHANDQPAPVTNGIAVASHPTVPRKRRVSNIFSSSSPSSPNPSSNAPLTSKSFVSIYASPKPKDKKKAPLLTILDVTQAFAVYPERPEMISKSTLMKVEGSFDGSEMAGAWKGREAWAFIMPEGEKGNEKQQAGAAAQGGGQVAEMLKWIVAFHDAFKLYGRPDAWTWDPRDLLSLMYGYPVGPMKESLFLDREITESMDPKEDRTSFYRLGLKKLLQQHMRLPVQVVNPQNRAGGQSPTGVPVGGPGTNPNPIGNGGLPSLPQSSGPPSVGGPQLPPLSFGSGEAVKAPNSAVNPNANNVPAKNNDVPSSRLSTIEESSVTTHNQHQHPTVQKSESQGVIVRAVVVAPVVVAPAAGGNFTPSLPPPPPILENSVAPAVPAKLSPSSMTGASPRQPLHSSTGPSPLSQSQPQSLQGSTTSVVPPRFQNQGQGGSGKSTPGSRLSPPPGPGASLVGPPPGQTSRVGSPAAGPSVPNQQPGATATRLPIGPPQPHPFGNTSESANVTPGVTNKPWTPSRPQLLASTTNSTIATTATSGSGGQDTEESNDLLKEPGFMFILGDGVGAQPLQNTRQEFTPGYRTGVSAGLGGLGSGLGPAGVGAGLGAGVGADVGAGLGTGLIGTGVGSGGLADNENDDDDADLYGSNGEGRDEATSLHSTAAGNNALAAPSPQTPKGLRPYAGIATESEDSHYHQQQQHEREQQSGTGQYMPGPPVRKGTPMSFVGENSSLVPTKAQPETTSPLIITKTPVPAGQTPTGGIPDRLSPTRLGLGRKPSGARELGTPRHVSNLASSAQSYRSTTSATSVSNSIVGANSSSVVGGDNISTSSRTFTEDGSVMEATVGQASKVMVGAVIVGRNGGTSGGLDDGGEEALAALTYLDYADGGEPVTSHGSSTTSTGPTPTTMTAAATPSIPVPPSPPEVLSSSTEPLKTRYPTVPARSSGAGGVSDANEMLPYTESSFAPSNKAAERKAKVQAQKDAQHAAVHKPGRVNGRKKSMAGAWDSSEDEDEEEEEDEEDEDVDSDGAKRRGSGKKERGAQQQLQGGPSGSASSSALGHGRPGLQIQPVSTGIGGDPAEVLTPSQLRPPRNLPQIPGRRSPSGEENTLSRRIPSEQYLDGGRRTYYEEGPQIKTQAEAPMPGAQRQTIWTKVLDPVQQVGRPQAEPAAKDTFVQLEPSETMTKAFALHGLLSVGMQDKEDRSAKRQEELARESGASLINVPNKPPPPQSGLLGYVTAHERERKRDGGFGATLTEREREKRVAEERQRRLDEQQRQQLDQMQQGMMYNPMMNPMMMNMMMNPMMTGAGLSPMMTGGGMGGMSPMITGGGMGMNPMMGGFGGMMGGGGGVGFSPQHMFAAQHAAQAYQQAMTAFSVAGSQVGGPNAGGGVGGNGAEGVAPTSQGGNNPNVGMSPGMGGMMSPGMPGNMGFDPRMSMFGMNMMGMGMGMPPMGMGGLGPQMTGMSNFDAIGSPALGFANPGGGGGMGMGMSAPPNANELGGPGNLGLQPPTMHSQFSSRTSSPARRGSPQVSGPNNTMNGEQHERGRPSRPASPK